MVGTALANRIRRSHHSAMRRKGVRFEIPDSWSLCFSVVLGVALALNWTGLRSGDRLVAWIPMCGAAAAILMLTSADWFAGIRLRDDSPRWHYLFGTLVVGLPIKLFTIPIEHEDYFRVLAFGLLAVPWVAFAMLVAARPLTPVSVETAA